MPYGRKRRIRPPQLAQQAQRPYKDIIFEWRQTTRLSNIFGTTRNISTGAFIAGGGGEGAVAAGAVHLNCPYDALSVSAIPPQAAAAWYPEVMEGTGATGQPAGWRGHCVWGCHVKVDWHMGEDSAAAPAASGQPVLVGMFPTYGGVVATPATLWGTDNQALMNFMYAKGIERKYIYPSAIAAQTGWPYESTKGEKTSASTSAYYDFGKLLGSNQSLKEESLSDLSYAGLYADKNMQPTTKIDLNLFTMVDTSANTMGGAFFNYDYKESYVTVSLKMYTRLYAQSNLVPGEEVTLPGESVLQQLGAKIAAEKEAEDPMEEYEEEAEEYDVCESQAQGRHCTCGHGVDRTGCEA